MGLCFVLRFGGTLKFAEMSRPLKIALCILAFIATAGLAMLVAWVFLGRAEAVAIAEDSGLIFGVVVVPVVVGFLIVWLLHRSLMKKISRNDGHYR